MISRRLINSLSAVAAVLFSFSAAAASLGYTNNGIVTNVQVDAENFVNNGVFRVFSFDVPWSSLNTANFVNRGEMSGSIGFEFVNTAAPYPHRASSFFNARSGQILGSDGGGFSPIFFGQFTGGLLTPDLSFVRIEANSITNHGQIGVGVGGLITLRGNTIDLTGSSVLVDPTIAEFNFFSSFFGRGLLIGSTNFIPDVGIFDLSWGGPTLNTNMFVGNILGNIDPTSLRTPFYDLTNQFGFCSSGFTTLTNASTWVFESLGNNPSNINVHVVAVQVPPGGAIKVDTGFLPFTITDGQAQNRMLTPVIELSSTATNLVNLRLYTNTLYVIDQTASGTNFTLLDNLAAPTFRPAPIILSRTFPSFYRSNLVQANSLIRLGIFDDPQFTNQVVSNWWTAYAAQVESTASRLPLLPDIGVDERPGRIEIEASGELQLRNARIRGEGLLAIRATNFLGSSDAVIDSPRLNYDLTTKLTAAPLTMQNLAPEFVARFGGPIFVYGTVWTNLFTPADTNQVPLEYRFHLTVVDASQLHTVEKAYVHELRLRSPREVEIKDAINVVDRFQIDAPVLTIDNRVRLEPGLTWGPGRYTNLTSINLTENGFLEARELAEYSVATPNIFLRDPLNSFVNRGTVQAFAHLVDTRRFENFGSIIATNYEVFAFTNECTGLVTIGSTNAAAAGPITIHAREEGRVDGGQLATDMDITLRGPVFKFFQSRFLAGGSLYLEPSGPARTLTDAGDASGNIWTVTNGIYMGGSEPRPHGNLLGTTINHQGTPFAVVEHVWAADDLGPNTNAFRSNNLALGALRLTGAFRTDFFFRGANPNKKQALYVDFIAVEGDPARDLPSFMNAIEVADNFTVYFAELRAVNTNGVSTVITPETVAEAFAARTTGGKMVWVPFAGPNSSVDVPISATQSRRFNRALRESMRRDDDGDGVPNGLDPFPFGGDAPGGSFAPAAQVTFIGDNAVEIRFQAAASTSYTIEHTESLADPNWRLLTRVSNSEAIPKEKVVITFMDGPQRFYRISKP